MNRPQVSADGRWWWDGQQWRSLLSPDGTKRWDGKRWVAISSATADPTGMPSWLPAESAEALHGPPEVAASIGAPAETLPAWTGAPQAGRPWLIWGLVGIGAAALLLALWTAKDHLPSLPGLSSSNPPAQVPIRATPDLSLTQHQRADKVLNSQLAPLLVSAGQAEQVMANDCAAGHQLELPCRAAMADTAHKLSAVVDRIDRADVPPCIQPQLLAYRNYLNVGAQQLTQAIQYFDSNDATQESELLGIFAHTIVSSVPSAQALQAAFAACPNWAQPVT